MSIRIQISSEATTPTKYVSKRTGLPDQEQTGWAYIQDRAGVSEPYPTKITFVVDHPYPVGDYTLHPSSFFVGDWSKLQMTTRLMPLKPKASAA